MASSSANPFPLPATLKPLLQRVLSYWDDLKRGENAIPFSDDVNLSDFPDVSDRLLAVCSVLVDGTRDPDGTTPVPDGAVVDVLPPFAGG